MSQSQFDHLTPIQKFLAWEASPDTLCVGVKDSKQEELGNYISSTSLDRYFGSQQVVREILDALLPETQPDLYYVGKHYRYCLAILLSIHQGPMIHHFIEYPSLKDQLLPFPRDPPIDFPVSSEIDLFAAFYDRQWRYLPTQLMYKMRGPLSPHTILPFQILERLGRGRSAKIYKIQVDEEYNALHHPVREACATVHDPLSRSAVHVGHRLNA